MAFSKVQSARTPHSVFDLSYSVKTSIKMGGLYPVACDEVIPGGRYKIGNQVVIRFQPLIAPIMHEINAFLHWFFVPYRLLSDDTFDWEKFITGGDYVDDPDNPGQKMLEGDSQVLPRWRPSEGKNTVGSLWDYLGFPTNVIPEGALPLDFPRRAYNFIYNEYYRDENLIDEVDWSNEDILQRCWEKDYFTSSLPFQQKGNSPALPLIGTGSAIWSEDDIHYTSSFREIGVTGRDGGSFGIGADGSNLITALNRNNIDLSNVATADINDLRLAFQIQKWMERNARSGSRYTEFLRAHYGVSPRDERLQRPEYIGGMRSPVIIQEVLQTSSTDDTSPQGNLAGKAIVGDNDYCGSYHATEFGLMMCIMSVMPRTNYMNGINRQWLRRSRYDFYSPEFQNLSEQAVETAEIYASNSESDNKAIFGFQGRFDELRTKQNIVTGDLRSTLDYWHLGRKFNTKPELNKEFVTCNSAETSRIFADQQSDPMIVEVGNAIRAVLPIGYMAEPGLIDHV